ncbi:YlbF family regulator [Chengkuizengella sediminis]|uniref:YlbF family regulator n=1 Tax=Chengkuizengella sediminis TaxID=1885917 RepID=UPI001389DF50|nr:YlbF family regulator [Chengkuizengella sediminis]NDI36304.1 YlbF family regulator [Chengkuizengella sediminis]
MNIYDKAHELAKALKESDEVKQLDEVRAEIEKNEEASKMLQDFTNIQNELQQKMMIGEQPSEEEMGKIQKLYEVLQLNPLLSKLFETEQRVSVIIQDVHKIINEPLQGSGS